MTRLPSGLPGARGDESCFSRGPALAGTSHVFYFAGRARRGRVMFFYSSLGGPEWYLTSTIFRPVMFFGLRWLGRRPSPANAQTSIKQSVSLIFGARLCSSGVPFASDPDAFCPARERVMFFFRGAGPAETSHVYFFAGLARRGRVVFISSP